MKTRLPWLMLLVLVPVAARCDDVVCPTRTFGEGPLLMVQPRCVRVTPAGAVVLLQGRSESIHGAILTP
ncbi:MAG TPA: hypothetical protein VMY39_08905, partial [Planctomycetota bacterium]|nr:hypothetical protein [Planctomycetota bacterium]